MEINYDNKVNDIHESVIEGFEKIGAQKIRERISVHSLKEPNFSQVNNPTISSKNAYNASLSFSKRNINTHIGFSKNITFGDSYSIRDGSSSESIEHNTLISSNTANFMVGDSTTTTHAKSKRSEQSKDTYSIQKGTKNRSITHNSTAYVAINMSTEGVYYQNYTQKKTTMTSCSFNFSLNCGLIDYNLRESRISTYSINLNQNNFLASSRVFHLFLTGIASNTKSKKYVQGLLGDRFFMSKVLSRLYSTNYNLMRTNKEQGIITSDTTAIFAKVLLRSESAKILRANHRMIIG